MGRVTVNFLQKLPKAQRDILVRKATAMESRQPKPKTNAELAQALLRRTLQRGGGYTTGEEQIDYKS